MFSLSKYFTIFSKWNLQDYGLGVELLDNV